MLSYFCLEKRFLLLEIDLEKFRKKFFWERRIGIEGVRNTEEGKMGQQCMSKRKKRCVHLQ